MIDNLDQIIDEVLNESMADTKQSAILKILIYSNFKITSHDIREVESQLFTNFKQIGKLSKFKIDSKDLYHAADEKLKLKVNDVKKWNATYKDNYVTIISLPVNEQTYETIDKWQSEFGSKLDVEIPGTPKKIETFVKLSSDKSYQKQLEHPPLKPEIKPRDIKTRIFRAIKEVIKSWGLDDIIGDKKIKESLNRVGNVRDSAFVERVENWLENNKITAPRSVARAIAIICSDSDYREDMEQMISSQIS